MRKIILLNQAQFGYHSIYYNYCKYLSKYYKIIYLCWDHNLPHIRMEKIEVHYVSREGNKLIRTWRFLKKAFLLLNDKPDLVFINYFKLFSMSIRILRPSHNYVLDIRTGSVKDDKNKRILEDIRLKIEAKLFRNITVISNSLSERLKLTQKAHILPLGAEIISCSEKKLNDFRLLYVGTLFNRNIEKTIKGFKLFYDEYGSMLDMSYTIIGSGSNNEEDLLKQNVTKYGLSKIVKIEGRIPYYQIKPFFNTHNIGVSYVPMTPYYDVQPVTKTFEYLLSGMVVIGTKTSENAKVINAENGVLIGDTEIDFFNGLIKLYNNKEKFSSETIRASNLSYTWANIVHCNLFPYLESVLKKKNQQVVEILASG